jgi:epoxyqueuosine reductase
LASRPGNDQLALLARRAGFNRAAVVDPRLLPPWAGRIQALRRKGGLDREQFNGLGWGWIEDPGSWAASHSILICCLSCLRDEPDDPSVSGDPHALIAPFARAHYYRSAILLMRPLAAHLEAEWGFPRGSIRLFSNSRIPEKPLLAATGMGSYGRNGLCLVPGLGSLFIIAGAVIPVPSVGGQAAIADEPRDMCGSCSRCIEACPTGAIVEPGVVDPARCLQGWAGIAADLPDGFRDAWGARLYGCQACQSACPHNSGLTEPARPAPGEIGPGIPLRVFLRRDARERREGFRGTALGMSWISDEALLRNALIAAGNRGDAAARGEVARHARSGSPLIQGTARWALDRLG